jgi:hypothetical protein
VRHDFVMSRLEVIDPRDVSGGQLVEWCGLDRTEASLLGQAVMRSGDPAVEHLPGNSRYSRK